MKRKGKILLTLLAVALLLCIAAVTLAACGDKNDDAPQISGGSGTTPSEHEHTFEEKWSYNDEYHWHAANCGHDDQMKDREEHELVWTTTTPPSCEDDGVQTGTCVCGYSETKSIDALEHDFNTAWVYDDYEHWHKCSRCDETDAHIAHELVDHNCDCGYSEFTPESEFTFSEIDGEWAITGYSGNRSVVVIPSTYRGRNVVELGMGAFYGNTSIKKVYIPDTVTSMRDGVFDGCVNIEEVTSPAVDLSSVPKDNLKKLTLTNATRIEAEAFKDYTKLADINLPVDDIVFVGKDAFANTAWLNAKKGVVYIGKVLYTYVGTTPNSFELSVEDDTVAISPSAFEGKNIYQVTIPNSVSIGANAFKDTNIQRAIIPTSAISAIPKSNLRYLEITSGTSIAKGALKDCKNLQEIVLPFVGGSANATVASESTLFGYIFGSAKPTENTSYYTETKQYYSSDKFVTYYIPSGLNAVTIKGNILYGAFYGCKMLWTVNLGEEVKSIGSGAFSGCTNISKVNYLGDVSGWWEISFGSTPLNSSAALYFNSKRNRDIFINEVIVSAWYIPAYTFSGCYNMTSITIPNSVKSIGSGAFSGCTNISTATMPANAIRYIPQDSLATVTITSGEIGASAFSDCTGLQTVTIGEGVTSIGEYAFSNCTGLKEITIPDSVQSIGSSAFSGCTDLQIATIGNSVQSIGSSAFSGCTDLQIATIGNSVQSIGSSAFSGCTGLQKVTIGAGVQSIGDYAFRNCTGLTSITIPDSVTRIDDDAFYNCTGLQTVTIGNGVQSIGDNAFEGCTGLQTVNWNAANCTKVGVYSYPNDYTIFEGCTKLTTVNIGEDVQSIPAYAFYNCTGLSEITIPGSVTSIGSEAFYKCTGLQTAIINAQNIGSSAFSGCTGLSEITIPNSVTSIDDRAFGGCTGLKTVNWNATNCTEAGSSLFSGCEQLAVVNIGDNVQTIPRNAFENRTGLTEITIPDSVQSIGNNAFSGCTGLQKVNWNAANCTKVGVHSYPNDYTIFRGCTKITTVNIGEDVQSIPAYAFYNCTNITKVNYLGTLKGWCEIEFGNSYANPLYGTNYNKSGTAKLYVNNVEVTGDVNIPSGTTNIGIYAFYGLTGITSVTIPDNVTSIGDNAFANCTGLQTVNWNALNCTKAGEYNNYPVFAECNKLTIVNIGENVQSIPAYAFYDCRGLKEITIPGSVTSIGNYAFSGCEGLSEITIPDNVTSIGDNAFANCTGLQTVNWNAANCTKVGVYSYPNDYTIFKGCTKLTTVNIGEDVQSIPDDAFCERKSIIKVNYLGTLKGWCEIEFGNSYANPLYNNAGTAKLYVNDKEVTGDVDIPSGTSKISNYAFYGLTDITSVTIPDSVTSIGYDAFYGCTGLQTVTIGKGVKIIDGYAFYGCTGLQTVYYEGTSDQWNSILESGGNDKLENAKRYYFSEQPNYDGNHWHWDEETHTPKEWAKQD